MSYFDALILGIIEGITEFLPISSTGHLILASQVLGLGSTELVKSFEILIQLGAISAVLLLFWKKFLEPKILAKLVVAFVPTGIAGLLLYPFVKSYLLGSEVVVLWALLLGGIFLIIFELIHKESPQATASTEAISYIQSFLVGLFQAIAIIPGVSRSAATIIGGRLIGLSRTAIVEFSFLLAVPTMIAAVGLDIVKNPEVFAGEQLSILGLGFVVSFIVALLSIKFLLQYIRKHTFVAFGVYRILLAIAFWLLIL